MRPKRNLWWGTLTLTSAALASRGLGLVYRVLLARFLGAEGLGFFQMIFPLYLALVTLSVAGMPVAVSQMVAEGKSQNKALMRMAWALVLAISVPLVIVVYVWAQPLALTLYHDTRFVPLLWALSPALLAVAFSSVLRGYFIGLQQVEIPAMSQVAEQLARVVIMLGILSVLGQQIPHAPLIAVVLIPAGESVSLVILATAYWRQLPRESTEVGRPIRIGDILRLSVPVTFTRLLGSLVAVIEATIIPLRLVASGMSRFQAVQYFGQLTGMALPLIFFPTALTLSLATNLVPIIAQAHANQDLERIRSHIESSLRATTLVTVPVTAVLLTIGVQLDDLFFHTQIPATVFVPLVVGAFFLYFDITFAGILRGMGRTVIPMRNDLIASGLEVLLIWILGAREGIGAQGIAWAFAAGFFLSFALNLMATAKLTHYRVAWGRLLARPTLASVPAVLVISWWQMLAPHYGLNHVLVLFASLVFAILTYLAGWYIMRWSWPSVI